MREEESKTDVILELNFSPLDRTRGTYTVLKKSMLIQSAHKSFLGRVRMKEEQVHLSFPLRYLNSNLC